MATRKKLTAKQTQFKERVKEEVAYIDDTLQVHFSFASKTKFHIDIIEDYCLHFHIHGAFEDGYMEITSVSSHLTIGISTAIFRLLADLMDEYCE